jgi:glycosyltransferase involved in cell wall biosynthesis
VAFEDRHFTIVARLVPKKNLSAAIKAYNIYRSNSQGSPRELHIFGSGQLEGELLHLISRLDISGVRLFGFVQAPEVAAALGKALALILPSTEEQWGLVINEALAMGLPILCSDNVGARDSLVRAGINGMVFEPDNIEGLAYFMMKLATDKDEWIRFCKGSTKLAYLADTTKFAEGVAAALNANASSSAVRY